VGKFFKSYYFISLFLTLILSLLVWFLPEFIGIEFLFEKSTRWIMIGLLTSLCLIFLGSCFWMNKKRNDDAYQAYGNNSSVEDSESEIVKQQALEINNKLNETLALLKRNKYPLHEIPHYIIIGPPGSGKTTILKNSNLEEPLALRDQGPHKDTTGLGGTRNCDWWITNEAILIDTAGRYFSDESNSAIDKKVWKSFLQMLCKTRKNVPINGVLITFDINELLSQSPEQRQLHIGKIQQHLYELNDTLGIRYPIYVLFTKLDLIAGFTQYFSKFEEKKALLDQVFGFTFPLEEIQTGGFAKFKAYFTGSMNKVSSNSGHFSDEFDLLIKRLNEGVIASLAQTNNINNRELIYRFPQELNHSKQVLEDFISLIFQPSHNFDPVLRGIYFTSGTQMGSPIERVMTTHTNKILLNINSISTPYQGEGRSYFINTLLKKVVFEEQNLVSFGRGHLNKLSYRLLSAALISSFMASLAYGVWFWPVSAGENEDKLSQIKELIADYKAKKPEKETVQSNLAALLPALDDAYNASQVFQTEKDPTSMHHGLYQGEEFTQQQFYQNVLNRVFLRHIALYLLNRMKQTLENSQGQNEINLYTQIAPALEAYLMIKMKDSEKHFNKERFDKTLSDYWLEEFKDNTYDRLSAHLTRLMPKVFIEEDEINDRIFIAQLRAKLIRERSMTDRLYDGITRDVKELTDIEDFKLNKAESLFSPREGYDLPTVPGFYTALGYCGFFRTSVGDSIVREIERMNWLLDEDKKIHQNQDLIKDIYAKKYIKAWKQFLGNLRIKKMEDMKDISDRLYALSTPDSVLKTLLKNIKENTDSLLACSGDDEEHSDKKGTLGKVVLKEIVRKNSTLNKANRLNNKLNRNKKGRRQKIPSEVKTIRAAFTHINGLDIKELDDILKKVQSVIDNKSDNADIAVTNLGREINNLLGHSENSEDGTQDLKRLFNSVKDSAESGAEEGKDDRVKTKLNTAWQAILSECQTVAGTYPPNQAVSQGAFASFFSRGGTLDNFEKNYFNPAKSEIPTLTEPALFNDAKYLREAFFNGSRLGVNFTLTPTVPSGIISATFRYGSKTLFYRAGEPPRSESFDWPNNGEQPSLTLKLKSGDSPEFSAESHKWAIFNFIKQVKKGNTLIFSQRGGSIQYELKVNNTQNSFNRIINISCPKTLF